MVDNPAHKHIHNHTQDYTQKKQPAKADCLTFKISK